MLTQCPYPDCKVPYKIKSVDKLKSYLLNETCSTCQRFGRVKPLEIIDKLRAREKFYNQNANDKNNLIVKPGQVYALLEDIRSLWNVGSIFRTADAVDISQLFLSGITGCPPSKEITKTALGAEETISWQYICHPLDIIPIFKANNVTVLGLERNSKSVGLFNLLKEKTIMKPICLVVGNENSGLSPETIEHCDYICDLPMKGKKESLNVASAFAVATYFIDQFANENS